MRADQGWQLGGVILEFAGLLTVAIGISLRRAHFTKNPRLDQRVWAAVQGFAQRFRSRPAQTITSGPIRSTVWAESEVSGSVTLGPWDDLDDEEKFKRARENLQNLQTQVEQVNRRIDQERKELANATDRQDRERAELEAELREAVADSAAGNLRLETFGVFLLALGLVLQGVGIVVG